MLSFPLITRELRIQSRKRATYNLRVGWGLAAVLVLGFFVREFPQHANNGRVFLAVIHACLAVMLFVIAPIGAADAISREKREGTLGLLMLTPLTAVNVVIGKLAAHAVRLGYFVLLSLPFIMIPVMMGGVELHDFLLSLAILVAILAAGLAAGLLASVMVLNFGPAVCLGLIFSALFTVAIGGAATNLVFELFPVRRFGDVPWSIRLFVFGPLLMLLPMQAREVASMFVATRWSSEYVEVGLLLASFAVLAVVIAYGARKVARHAEFSGETKKQAAFRRRFLTPVIWKAKLQKSLRRNLNRNPLIWLEYRTAWARTAHSMLILLFLAVDAIFLMTNPNRSDFLGCQSSLLTVFIAFVAFKSSNSFQTEKESGAFELLLVTPLTENKLLGARLRAVANYYFLPVVLFIVFGGLGYNFAGETGDLEPIPLSTAVYFFSMTASLVTVPICGLYFALRSPAFLTAFLSTVALAVVTPLATWNGLNGMLWMAYSRSTPNWALQTYAFLQAHWWPVLVAIGLFHVGLAAYALRATAQILRDRDFTAR